MNRAHVVGVVLAVTAVAGCSYNAEGYRLRTGGTRFDAQSVGAALNLYTLQEDGTWAGMSGDRYERMGDEIRKVGAFGPTPALIPPTGWVTIDRHPDGLSFTPSWLSGPIWTFVTQDGGPIPRNLEVPLYLAATMGLGGQWVGINVPGSELAGIELKADCGLVLFSLKERQVAGWVSRQGAVCPAPTYPPGTVAKLAQSRREVWDSAERPLE